MYFDYLFNRFDYIVKQMKNIGIIGSGFSSLSAACYLAQAGHKVSVYEKNDQIGGRARVLEKKGFRFDMGPSWYWMPDVFESFYADFGKQASDYYQLIRLSPAYRVYFEDSFMDIPNDPMAIYELFESEEKGSAGHLREFLKKAAYNYDVAIKNLVYKPGLSPLELITPQTITHLNQFFTTISHEVRKRFKSKKLIKILEFPVLFLGAKPQNTPSFYSFMNYADFVLGTWYPKGGMYKIVEALESLAIELGVHIHINSPVDKIIINDDEVAGLVIHGKRMLFDVVLSGADYYYTETLLPQEMRVYSERYWKKKTFAPSALIFYVGLSKKIKGLPHHNLFFDEDFELHAKEIYDDPVWPEAPLFYASFTSVTDDSVAPAGKECGFFLIPLAPDLSDDKELHEQYFNDIIKRLEDHTKQSIMDFVEFKESYCVDDFKSDYNSYKGNAYGMANTIMQTAFLRPGIKSKKLRNLYFTGQLTVPGPGVPPALISGKIAADQIVKDITKNQKYEVNI